MSAWLALYLLLDVADYKQTTYALSQPGYYETNPFLGRHPSRAKINRAFAAGLGFAYYIDTHSGINRKRNMAVLTGFKFAAVANNYYVGTEIRF